jgi:hypothetical protein
MRTAVAGVALHFLNPPINWTGMQRSLHNLWKYRQKKRRKLLRLKWIRGSDWLQPGGVTGAFPFGPTDPASNSIPLPCLACSENDFQLIKCRGSTVPAFPKIGMSTRQFPDASLDDAESRQWRSFLAAHTWSGIPPEPTN